MDEEPFVLDEEFVPYFSDEPIPSPSQRMPAGPRMPKLKGFTTNAAVAAWITCDECGDNELVYGDGRAQWAKNWAEDHRRNGCTPR